MELFNAEQPFEITINKDKSFGFSIIGGADTPTPGNGIFVKSIMPGSAASIDGKLMEGDEILSVNGSHLDALTHFNILDLFRKSNSIDMKLLIRRRKSPLPSIEQDQTLSKQISFISHHSPKINRDSCFHLIRQNDDNIWNKEHRKGEVTFAETKIRGENKATKKPNIEMSERGGSRLFLRGRMRKKTLNPVRKETEHKLDAESSSSPNLQDENDMFVSHGPDDDDANDSSFYEPTKGYHTDGRDTPLSGYILQSRQSSIKHENYELRKYSFKKRRQDELGVCVEPCIIGNHHYLKVVDMSPDSFLLHHQLVQIGDLLVSYNGLPLKDASKFESILRNRGITLEDVCMEILREQSLESHNPEIDIYEMKGDYFNDSDQNNCNLISTEEESRTPSPTKPMTPISRDSGMIDGGPSSPEGTWGWTAGTESEMDESRADSPRFGLYFFDGHSEEISDKDVSLVNFGKLSTELSTNHRTVDSKPILSQTPSNYGQYFSTQRSHDNSMICENILHKSNLESCFSNFKQGIDSLPNIPSSLFTSSFNTTAEMECKPTPLPRKRIVPFHFQNKNTVSASIPDSKQNNYSHFFVQSKKIEASPDLPITSIDDEIQNEINSQNINDYSQNRPKISYFEVATSPVSSQSPTYNNLEASEDDLYFRLIVVHPNDRRDLLNYINYLLNNPNELAKLPKTRVERGIFMINMNHKKVGLRMILTPLGGVIQKIENDRRFDNDVNIRIGDFVLALNSTPLALMSSTAELKNFLDSLKLESHRYILCRNPKVIVESLPFLKESLDAELGLKPISLNLPQNSTQIGDRDSTELEFIISNQPVDMGLGHVIEILGVNTPSTTVVYSEKREEFVNLDDIHHFCEIKKTPFGMDLTDRRDSFEDDMLLDGQRCGFVSRVDSFKRKFKKPNKLLVSK